MNTVIQILQAYVMQEYVSVFFIPKYWKIATLISHISFEANQPSN
jgi:hypothetical protein